MSRFCVNYLVIYQRPINLLSQVTRGPPNPGLWHYLSCQVSSLVLFLFQSHSLNWGDENITATTSPSESSTVTKMSQVSFACIICSHMDQLKYEVAKLQQALSQTSEYTWGRNLIISKARSGLLSLRELPTKRMGSRPPGLGEGLCASVGVSESSLILYLRMHYSREIVRLGLSFLLNHTKEWYLVG